MKNYPLNKVDYYKRFRDMVDGMAERYGDKPALSWFSRSQEESGVSFVQLRDDVRHLQEMLVQKGLAGKHIAIVGENSYEWLLVYWAVNYCGGMAVCVDIEQPDETIIQMLTMADTDAIFVAPAYVDICREYAGENVPMFLLSNKKGELTSVSELKAEGSKIWAAGEQNTEIDAQVKPENIASIVFTSGTTSQSKPVMLSQLALLTNAADAMALVKVGERVFTSLPFYHAYGLTCSVMAMLLPGNHVYINGNLKTVLRDLQLSKADTLLTVPLMLETIHNRLWMNAEESGKAESLKKLLKLKKFQFSLGMKQSGSALDAIREKCVGNIRLIICGGAHMSKEIMEEFMYMGVNVLQGYGITECSPLVCVNRNDANKLDSVGLVVPNGDIKIEDGEILVRGANLMSGYYKSPEMTEEVMRDGWFCTGDIGEIDKDGFLFITGRKKNLIVFKNGKKISPEKIEEKIKKIPLVQDVMVYGAASGVSTDDVQIAASIYPNQEKAEGMTSYEILELLQGEINKINNELPMYQQIQMITIREQEFSKTALQKIKRHMA